MGGAAPAVGGPPVKPPVDIRLHGEIFAINFSKKPPNETREGDVCSWSAAVREPTAPFLPRSKKIIFFLCNSTARLSVDLSAKILRLAVFLVEFSRRFS